MQDLRYGLRLIRKSPGFTSVAVIALALGIGANTAIFSVVNSVLLRPLPFRDSNRMVVVWENSLGQGWNRIGPSGPNYVEFREQNHSFADLALMEPGSGTLTGFGEPQQVPGMRVSNNFLSVIGVKPILGRDFLPNEGFAQRVGIIGYRVWERDLNRDPNVIGRRVIADGLVYTIIGVLPREFWSPVQAEVLVPWVDSDLRAQNRMDHRFGVIGHLKPGVSVEQATEDLTAIERRIGEQFPGMKGWGVTVVPLQQALAENVRTGLLLLLAAVALVLLIACANLANLMLARAAVRERETAVRVALGAGRWRLTRQFLTESTLLGLMGGGCGLLLALWGVDLLQRIVPEMIRLPGGAGEVMRPPIAVDGWAFLFTALVSVLTGLIFGVAPAIASAGADANEALREGGRGASQGGRRLRDVFAISEVALALVLLISSALTIKSFWRIQQVNPGFQADHVLAMEMELPTDSKYRTDREQRDFFRRVLDKVAVLPGVRSAGATNVLPLDAAEEDAVQFLIEGQPPLPSGQALPADYRAVSPDYFRALGVPLRRGRTFTGQDKEDRPEVAVINEAFARRYFAGGLDPIGQRLRFGRRGPREIIGIVGDVKHAGIDQQATPTIYTSYLQSPEMRMTLVVRTTAGPMSMVRAVKDAVYSIDKDQPVFKIRTMDQVVDGSESSSRFTLVLLGIFAAVALALASIGIYGVISYAVTQRTREIGIRIALGAGRRDVLRMVAGHGALLAVIGVGIGLAAAFALTRLMSSLLFGVSATDPLTFIAAPIFLAAVALAASGIPALRASRVDPVVALRYE